MFRFGLKMISATLCLIVFVTAFVNILQLLNVKTQFDSKALSPKDIYFALNKDLTLSVDQGGRKTFVIKVNKKMLGNVGNTGIKKDGYRSFRREDNLANPEDNGFPKDIDHIKLNKKVSAEKGDFIKTMENVDVSKFVGGEGQLANVKAEEKPKNMKYIRVKKKLSGVLTLTTTSSPLIRSNPSSTATTISSPLVSTTTPTTLPTMGKTATKPTTTFQKLLTPKQLALSTNISPKQKSEQNQNKQSSSTNISDGKLVTVPSISRTTVETLSDFQIRKSKNVPPTRSNLVKTVKENEQFIASSKKPILTKSLSIPNETSDTRKVVPASELTELGNETKSILTNKTTTLNSERENPPTLLNIDANTTTKTNPKVMTSKTAIIHSEVSNKVDDKQQCVIPNLNPFHPDILKYITHKWTAKCNIHQLSNVDREGNLRLKLKNVQRAGYYYIKRIDDFNIDLSEWHALTDEKYTCLKPGSSGCLRMFQDNLAVRISNNNGKQILSTERSLDLNCDDTNKIRLTENGNLVIFADPEICLFVDTDNSLKFSNSSCNLDTSKFIFKDSGLIQYRSSKQCLQHHYPNNLKLDHCNTYSTRFYFQPPQANAFTDLDVTIKLKEDFIRLDLTYEYTSKIEYHMFPVQNLSENINITEKPRKDSQLNIVMLMVDSLSRASAERYINKTYGMLERDANSIIMKGHTINGDGTTPQLCTMFVGKQEHELPEARRGFANSEAVDRWNFIFNDFHNNDYVTVYSEDEPAYNSFHYRLHGFKKPPTVKYLRPWWMAAERMIGEANTHSRACSHKFSFTYLKDFLRVYKQKATFSLMISSALTHAESTRATLIDEDIIEFYDWMKNNGYQNNTIIVLFGDHGNRASEFRSSLQGKLEERLPLMTFSFPPWFKEKHKKEFENMKENSELLTTHYDIHATLKHILTFPKLNFRHQYGRSLFTNIVRLNRTCAVAGIDQHWCPCLAYTNANTSDSIVQQLSTSIVVTINKRLKQYVESKEKCASLSLAKVIRAGKMLPNLRVQQYERTFGDVKCDNCGVELNKNFTANIVSYEIVLQVLPSKGLFEATADINLETNEITVNKEISRLNLYGDQPKCIADKYPYLRSFCYCKMS